MPIGVIECVNKLDKNNKIISFDGNDEKLTLPRFVNILQVILRSHNQLSGTFINSDIIESSLELINDGVINLTKDGNITKVNKAASKLLKSSADKLVGKKISEIFTAKNLHI